MKKILIIVNMLFLFILIGCTLNGEWQKNVTINGIDFAKVSVEYTDSGEVAGVRGIIKKSTVIQSYPCAVDWVHFDQKGNLIQFKLQTTIVHKNNSLPAGTWVNLKDDSSFFCVFPDNIKIQGYNCIGGGGSKGIQTSFYSDGKLKSFFSPEDVKIDGIVCKGNSLIPVNIVGLHPSGKLKECTLARDTLIDGKLYKTGSRVKFDERGNVINNG